MQFAENVPLAPYTTFQIGGPARWFAQAVTEEDLVAGVTFARERSLPLFILGGGSNLLVSDHGFPGLVMHIALRGITLQHQDRRCLFSVYAGEDWDTFVAQAVAEDCAGIECLSGIPGSVGGTPVQNVGAYGQEVSQTISSVRVLDRQTLQFVTLSREECAFGYRTSIFNRTCRGRYIVIDVQYALQKHGSATITYADLKRSFPDNEGSPPALADVRSVVRSIRARKGMLILSNEPDSRSADSRSAGSFFKNPVVPSTAVDRISSILDVAPSSVPNYPAGDGPPGRQVKLPAAWLLEQAGFGKGYSLGNAGISTRHTLALINRGGASAADIVALRDKVVDTVAARFGIHLEQEPVWLAAGSET